MSKIEWTEKTWNPITGCTEVSEGCKNCYAKSMAGRLKAMGVKKYKNEFDVTLHHDEIDKPLHWKKPCKIFVCSMGDFFHSDVPPEFIDELLEVMGTCPQHTFQILTKRPENIYDKLYKVTKEFPLRYLGGNDYVENVWIGTTIESSHHLKRSKWLRGFPASVKFLSIEPMLSDIDLVSHKTHLDVDWVIAGCESGANRRHANIDWFRSLRDQCIDAEIPFFLKQMEVDNKVVKMPKLDGQIWDQYPIK